MLRTTLARLALVCAAASPAFALLAAEPQDPPAPSAEHAEILKGVGHWEGTLTTYMPGVPEAPVAAHETVEAIGGFWTQSRFECDFMGMPYVGTGCVGYDSAKKKYVGTWIDNMSSHLAVMEGERDPKSGALVMRYSAPDMTGAMVPHRIVTVGGDDAYTSTFYQGEGEGTKTMVIAMKREGQAPEVGGGK